MRGLLLVAFGILVIGGCVGPAATDSTQPTETRRRAVVAQDQAAQLQNQTLLDITLKFARTQTETTPNQHFTMPSNASTAQIRTHWEDPCPAGYSFGAGFELVPPSGEGARFGSFSGNGFRLWDCRDNPTAPHQVSQPLDRTLRPTEGSWVIRPYGQCLCAARIVVTADVPTG